MTRASSVRGRVWDGGSAAPQRRILRFRAKTARNRIDLEPDVKQNQLPEPNPTTERLSWDAVVQCFKAVSSTNQTPRLRQHLRNLPDWTETARRREREWTEPLKMFRQVLQRSKGPITALTIVLIINHNLVSLAFLWLKKSEVITVWQASFRLTGKYSHKLFWQTDHRIRSAACCWQTGRLLAELRFPLSHHLDVFLGINEVPSYFPYLYILSGCFCSGFFGFAEPLVVFGQCVMGQFSTPDRTSQFRLTEQHRAKAANIVNKLKSTRRIWQNQQTLIFFI